MSRAKRLLAIDYGRRRIGLATCDALGIAVQAYGFIARESDEQAATVIAAVAKKEDSAGIVAGLPLHASGEAGDNVRYVRRFLRELRQRCPLPVYEVDERHSSSEAEQVLIKEGKWPAKPGEVDAKAAAIILRRYLNGQ
ncbi:MAG: Holliday junction resolvase RuvX [Planctomycetota bacterium]|nr:Holliday junction resolvase RuvX [Planctomycetota bacterium]